MDIEAIVERYDLDGYVLVEGLLSHEEVSGLQAVTARVAEGAAGMTAETPVFDFEEGHTAQAPRIQRIKKPHRVDPFYLGLARHPTILSVVRRIIGDNVRLSHSKINMKAARQGSPLEWHQDWAFAPHSNMSTCVASVMIDDADLENGAMQVVSGSHRGPLLEHHDSDNYFVGAIAPGTPHMELARATPLVGRAGTISFHHPLTIHGSGANRSGRSRRMLFLEYAAVDAFPFFYQVELVEYDSRIVSGSSTREVRFEPHYVKLPFPSRAGSSIYKVQATVKSKFFEPVVHA